VFPTAAPFTRLQCTGVRRHVCALDSRGAGAGIFKIATARAPQSCPALRANPERRHAAALLTAVPQNTQAGLGHPVAVR